MSNTMSISEASKVLGIGVIRLKQLVRDGRLVQQGENEIDADSVNQYKATRQRGGVRVKGQFGAAPQAFSIPPFVPDSLPTTTKPKSLDRESVILRLLDKLDGIKIVNKNLVNEVNVLHEEIDRGHQALKKLQADVARLTSELDEATKPAATTQITEKEVAALRERAADLFPELVSE